MILIVGFICAFVIVIGWIGYELLVDALDDREFDRPKATTPPPLRQPPMDEP